MIQIYLFSKNKTFVPVHFRCHMTRISSGKVKSQSKIVRAAKVNCSRGKPVRTHNKHTENADINVIHSCARHNTIRMNRVSTVTAGVVDTHVICTVSMISAIRSLSDKTDALVLLNIPGVK